MKCATVLLAAWLMWYSLQVSTSRSEAGPEWVVGKSYPTFDACDAMVPLLIAQEHGRIQDKGTSTLVGSNALVTVLPGGERTRPCVRNRGGSWRAIVPAPSRIAG
jgi:hypothetical protein